MPDDTVTVGFQHKTRFPLAPEPERVEKIYPLNLPWQEHLRSYSSPAVPIAMYGFVPQFDPEQLDQVLIIAHQGYGSPLRVIVSREPKVISVQFTSTTGPEAQKLLDQLKALGGIIAPEQSPPRKLDQMHGVIREIDDAGVAVSLFHDHDEFAVQLDRSVFETGAVPLREDQVFEFWVERFPDGKERPVVKPSPRRELSFDERRRIDREIAELLNDEEKTH